MTARLERAAIVVLAGGVGTRVGAGVNKALLALGGMPMVARSVRTALDAGPAHVVVVLRPEDREELAEAIRPLLGGDEVWIVEGGIERHDSEWNALIALRPSIESGEVEVVAMHDAARPLASEQLYLDIVTAARLHGGAIPTIAMDHLLGMSDSALVAVQTPQAFRAPELLTAYQQADAEGFHGTDTAACVERYSDVTIVGVPSSTTNLKVTYPEDLAAAEELLAQA